MLARQMSRVVRLSGRTMTNSNTPNPDTYEKTLNEHGGWICKDKEEWAKWWPELAEKKRMHTEQMKAHIPVHMQGKYGRRFTNYFFLFLKIFTIFITSPG